MAIFFLSPDKSLTLTQHVNANNGPPLIISLLQTTTMKGYVEGMKEIRVSFSRFCLQRRDLTGMFCTIFPWSISKSSVWKFMLSFQWGRAEERVSSEKI